MPLGVCLSQCCGTCNICDHKQVPTYLDLTFTGWADFYVQESDVFPCTASTTHLISEASVLNATIRVDFVAEWSDAEVCCAAYYGEIEYPDFIWTGPPDSCDPMVISEAGYSRNNTIGFWVRVAVGGTPGTCQVAVAAVAGGAEAATPADLCELLELSGGMSSGEISADWFCACDGDSEELLASTGATAFDENLKTINGDTRGITDFFNGIPMYPVYSGSGPSTIVLSASCSRVAL